MGKALKTIVAILFALCPIILVLSIAYVFTLAYWNIYVMAFSIVAIMLSMYSGYRIFVLINKHGVLKFISNSYTTKELEDIDF
mgnify:CR=1 FL=1